MRSVSELTRVHLGRWVRVLLRDGTTVVGKVIAHHDNKPARHTVETLDGKTIVVDFPTDRLLKTSVSQIKPHSVASPDVPDAPAIPVIDAAPAPVAVEPTVVTVYKRDKAALWTAGIGGFALGVILTTLIHFNVVGW